MKKLIQLLAICTVALMLTGISYALWSENLTISGTVDTSELDWEIEQNSVTIKDQGIDWTCDCTCDPPSITNIRQLDKDVGSTTTELSDSDGDGDLDLLTITVSNAYPGYYNHIDFWIHNNGEIALKIWKVIIDGHEFTGSPSVICLDLDNDGDYDIIIRWGDSWGVQVEPCDSLDISFDFCILQPADQNDHYSFTIEYLAVQWNEYPS